MVEIERMGSEGWERVRAVRLRALRDAPDAFGSTLEDEEARPAASWRQRLADTSAATFLATANDQDVGLAVGAGFRGRAGAAGLFAMWVAPGSRGRGAADLLVAAVVTWAKETGHARLLLEVGDENPAAIRLYERGGFRRTGATGTLPEPRTHVREHERELEL